MSSKFTDLSFLEHKDKRQVIILDTNVVLHDPASIFRFEEHIVLIPFSVLEEIDVLSKEFVKNVNHLKKFAKSKEELSAIEEAASGNNRLLVHPNPAGSSISITVHTEPNALVEIKLTSITGSQVMISDEHADPHGRIEKNINLSHLKPGIYLVYLQTTKETMAYKLIITR